MSELKMSELDKVNGGEVTLVTDKGYVGLQVTIGGYGFAVWTMGGSLCGSLVTPKNPLGIPGRCIP